MSDGVSGATAAPSTLSTPSTTQPATPSSTPPGNDEHHWQYPLDLGAAVTVERDPAGPGFICTPVRTFAAATPAWGLSQDDLDAARTLVHARGARRPDDRPTERVPAERRGVDASGSDARPTRPARPAAADRTPDEDQGMAEAFVNLLRHEVIPPVPGFRVVRLVPPPEARGERPVDDENVSSVVVGERVVVTWVQNVQDADHEAPRTLSHLDAVGYFEVPETHGMLLWTAPSGREVPVAWATKYLPRARDGWDWCLELTQRALTATGEGRLDRPDPWASDFPARLGRTTAKLHLALATPSAIISAPTSTASPDLVKAWHSAARRVVRDAERVAREGELEGVADVLLPRLDALVAAVDELDVIAAAGEGVLTQRVHGDLHVGQILRWPGGLAVVDFHPCPVIEIDGLAVGQAMQPAARDVARLLRSLDHVARVVDKGTGFAMTDRVDAWSRAAREALLDAYRGELAVAGRPELLDERLLPAFEAEQLCREIVYASEHLPSWVYAPLGGLWQSFEADATRSARSAQSGARGRVDPLTGTGTDSRSETVIADTRPRGRRARNPVV